MKNMKEPPERAALKVFFKMLTEHDALEELEDEESEAEKNADDTFNTFLNNVVSPDNQFFQEPSAE